MSATNRGSPRAEHDFYVTPHWCVDRILERVYLPSGEWLEPGAGSGAIIKAAGPHMPGVRWTAIDIREECRDQLDRLIPEYRPEIIITDKYLSDESPLGNRRFNVVIGNPPYSLAMDFIKQAFKQADHILFLLRLNFLASQKRHEFLSNHMPDIYVIPNRPSFVAGRTTDATEYAWYRWDTRLANQYSKLEILSLTPDAVRRTA